MWSERYPVTEQQITLNDTTSWLVKAPAHLKARTIPPGFMFRIDVQQIPICGLLYTLYRSRVAKQPIRTAIPHVNARFHKDRCPPIPCIRSFSSGSRPVKQHIRIAIPHVNAQFHKDRCSANPCIRHPISNSPCKRSISQGSLFNKSLYPDYCV